MKNLSIFLACLHFIISFSAWGNPPGWVSLSELHSLTLEKEIKKSSSQGLFQVRTWSQELRFVKWYKKPMVTPHARDLLSQITDLNSGHVVKAEIAESSEVLWLIMHPAKLDVMDHILDQGPMGGNLLRSFVRQTAMAVLDLHKAGVCHNDIKPDNILIFDSGFKLADFDFVSAAGPACRQRAGTSIYGAPETSLIEIPGFQFYDCRFADIWSLGYSYFVAATVTNPWAAPDSKQSDFRSFWIRYIWDSIAGQATLERQLDQAGENLQSSFMDLVKKMLRIQPGERLSLEDVLTHPYLQED